MHTVLAVLIVAAVVLAINVLTLVINHFLSRGDVRDRLKVLEARLPKAFAELLIHGEEVDWTATQALGYAKAPEEQPLTPEGISAMLSPEDHDLLRQVAVGAYKDSAAEHMAWYNALHTPGFAPCLEIHTDYRTAFVLSAIVQVVLGILDERREQASSLTQRSEWTS